MAARRFEFVEGSSSKFWEIELDGSSFTTTWGKIGTAGQTGTKSFDSDDKAKKEYDKLVAEKTKKGYAETGAVVSSGTPTPKAAPTPKAPKAKKSDDDAPAEAAAPVVVEPPPPPKAPPTLAEEDQIFWSDALKKRVLPRRGGVEVKIVALHAEKKLREQVRAGFKAREKQQEKLVKSKADGADAIARVAKIIADDSGVPTADDAATMLAWLVFQEQWNMEMLDDEAVEWLIVAGSYALATEALLLSLERMFPGQAHYGTQNPEKFALYMQPTTSWSSNFHGQGALRGLDRLRELLVLASDADYQAARDAAAKVRSGGTDAQKVASSIVFPTESDWVRSDASLVDKSGGFRMVLLSVSDLSTLPATYAPSIDSFIPYRYRRKAGEPDCAATLLDTAGMSVASFFAKAASGGYASADTNKLWYATLAAVGHDDTVRVLVDKVGEKEAQAALAEAGQNQPRRVLRLLAKSAAARGKAGDPARAVLASLVRRSPELVDEVRPYLDADGTKAIDAAKAELGEAVADADSTDVPSFLSKPPWREAKKKAAGPQAKVSITPPATTMVWAPNQKEQWAQSEGWRHFVDTPEEWAKLVKGSGDVSVSAMAYCDSKLVRELAPRARSARYYDDESWYKRAVARHEALVVPFLLVRLNIDFAGVIDTAGPVGDAQLAPAFALALSTKKSLVGAARSWLLRHAEHAVAGLLEPALGKPGKPRDHAETALRFLASNGKADVVKDVAKRAGVDKEVALVLAADPLDKVPNKVAKLPVWADAQALPRPVLKDGKGALPIAATDALLEALSFSTLDDPYGGLDVVREVCEPKSLARLVWALFQAWLINGASSKEGAFALPAVGHFGDDDCARKLAALVREWPGEGGHARAVTGLDVLTAIGTDVALMHLNGIALKVKFKGLQAKAQEKIEAIAETRGLTREELEDRLAPDLGLDDDGSLKLDFGTRWFTVGFDEALRPFVKDQTGARIKDLPKPNKSDDEAKAKEASERWSQLKKDAKQAASLQILRLEMAMCGQRRFDSSVFVELFVQHPLVFHIVRRLVWGTFDDDGNLTGTFRVAEDRTFANQEDDSFSFVSDTQKVGIPHTLELDGLKSVTSKWSEVFGDYELVQPFPQLGRPLHKATDEQKKAQKLDVVNGITVKTGKVLGLESRRWRRGAPQDGGVTCWMEKHLKDGRVVYLDLDPGLFTGMLAESPEQKLGSAAIGQASYYWGGKDTDAFGTLDPIAFSELVRDLESLKG